MPATIPGIPLHAHKIRKTNPMRDPNLAPIQSQVVFFFLRGHGTLIYLISEFSLTIFSLSLVKFKVLPQIRTVNYTAKTE